MPHPFFPDPAFGWVFWGALVAPLAVASYTDLRYLLIPKTITLPLLGVGFLINIARGIWVGAEGGNVWQLGHEGAWIGALDGLLWALAGFVLGFGIFFLMFVCGTCRGGDVKLFAALGAWLGPLPTFYVLVGTLVLVWLLLVGRVATRLLRPHRAQPEEGPKRPQGGKRLTSYSLSVALSTAAIVLWLARVDLHLASPSSASGTNAQGAYPGSR